MARFAVHERGSVRHVDLADRPVRIGRDLGCELPLLCDGVEPEHAVVERGRTGWHLRAVGDARMRVNDLALPDRRLRDGDRVRIGEAELVFENPRPPDRDLPPQMRAAGATAARTPTPAADGLDRLRSTLRALASETDFRKLLRVLVDQVVSLTGAERGFLILRSDERRYEMVAARSLDGEDVQRPGVKISRAVAEEVARTSRLLRSWMMTLDQDASFPDDLVAARTVRDMARLAADLGLNFGAIDAMVDADGTPYVIDVNTTPAYYSPAPGLADHLRGGLEGLWS